MEEAPASVTLSGVTKTYGGADRPALQAVTLEIPAGSFFSILGPSGCGKTTLLRIIAGFEHPSSGRVLIGGRDVTGLRPRDRSIAMVFQDYALYPHMTVANNITFNLKNKRVPTVEVTERLAATARTLRIDHLLDKRPRQLSGGERQRVALGRALIRKPRVFLMDEPLSNLDLKLREAMRIELGRLHQQLGATVVYVTHDQSEAMTLSTDLAVMDRGCLQQTGDPADVYARPANTFVARFIGTPSMNLLRVRRAGSWLELEGGGGRLPAPDGLPVPDGTALLAGLRAHHLLPSEAGIAVTVALTEHFGRSNVVVCTPRGSTEALVEQESIQIETDGSVQPSPGTPLMLTAKAEHIQTFDTEGRAIACRAASVVP
jgi:ABC-type sugar transport system ATPase subunit